MTASIVFVPICSNCGTIIYGKVVGNEKIEDYAYTYSNSFSKKLLPDWSFEHQISPKECPECGEQFKKIIFPNVNYLIENGIGVDMMACAEEEHSRNERTRLN